MSTANKHLKAGSECPTLKEGQLRLYSMRFCPFVQRAKLVLAAKKIPYEEILINLSEEPDWYLAKNPVGEVPLLEWIDKNTKEVRAVPESLVVCDYLDDLQPEPRLHPTDPFLKAKQQVLVSRYGNVLSAFYGLVHRGEEDAVAELNTNLAVYEEALQGKFFGGSKPGMVDYMLWPWCERFPALKEHGFQLNADGKLPKLAAWVQAMEADEAVRSIKIPEATMRKFLESAQKDRVDYDIE